ncbi:unnamed protein product [Schistocephalus solidus]|uniref:Uncharacterized protein n=1 Tax=Schistocephalus solidus TaxID=70667 RepID=A0A183SGL9_SCHSO|nr:unnamed protein product [Schistocephalus solidus]
MAVTPIKRGFQQAMLESRELCWRNPYYIESTHQMTGFTTLNDYEVTDGKLQKSSLTITPVPREQKRIRTAGGDNLLGQPTGTWMPLDLTAGSADSSGDCYLQSSPLGQTFSTTGFSSVPGVKLCHCNGCHANIATSVADKHAQAWTPWCGLDTSIYTFQGQTPSEIDLDAWLMRSSLLSKTDACGYPDQAPPMSAPVSLSSGTLKQGFLFSSSRVR